MALVPYNEDRLQSEIDALGNLITQHGPQVLRIRYMDITTRREAMVEGQMRLVEGSLVFRYLDVAGRPNGTDVAFPVHDVHYLEFTLRNDLLAAQSRQLVEQLQRTASQVQGAIGGLHDIGTAVTNSIGGLHDIGTAVTNTTMHLQASAQSAVAATNTALQAQSAAHLAMVDLNREQQQQRQQLQAATQELFSSLSFEQQRLDTQRRQLQMDQQRYKQYVDDWNQQVANWLTVYRNLSSFSFFQILETREKDERRL